MSKFYQRFPTHYLAGVRRRVLKASSQFTRPDKDRVKAPTNRCEKDFEKQCIPPIRKTVLGGDSARGAFSYKMVASRPFVAEANEILSKSHLHVRSVLDSPRKRTISGIPTFIFHAGKVTHQHPETTVASVGCGKRITSGQRHL